MINIVVTLTESDLAELGVTEDGLRDRIVTQLDDAKLSAGEPAIDLKSYEVTIAIVA